MKAIIMAAFKTTEEKSIKYTKYKTIGGFIKAIEKVIREREPDYISVRIIKNGSEARWSDIMQHVRASEDGSDHNSL